MENLDNKIIKSITNKLNEYINDENKSIYEALLNIPTSELYSLLMKIINNKVSNITCPSLLQAFNHSKFTKSSSIPQSLFHKLDLCFIDSITKNYESIELSPVSIMGANKITNTSQDKILSTIRNLELIGDLAVQLVYHHITSKGNKIDADYITSHRLFRNQNFGESSHYTNHFKMLSLGSNIYNNNIFLHLNKLNDHIIQIMKGIHQAKLHGLIEYDNIEIEFSNIRHFNELSTDHKFTLLDNLKAESLKERGNLNIINSSDKDINSIEELYKFLKGIGYSKIEEVRKDYQILNSSIEDLSKALPYTITINYNRISGLGHYNNYCYHIIMKKGNEKITIADGGITQRSGILTSDQKTHFIASGLGTEVLLKLFKKEDI